MTEDIVGHVNNEGFSKAAAKQGYRIDPDVMQQGYDHIGDGYNKLLPKNIKAKIDTNDKINLMAAGKDSQVQEIMGRAPTLAKIFVAVESGAGSIPASSLHDAWKEVARAAGGNSKDAAQVRTVLEGLLEKVVPKKDLAPFKELNRQWGAIADIEKAYRGGASTGVGAAAGYFDPAKLVHESGTSPNPNNIVDKAAQTVKAFEMRNYSPGIPDVKTIANPLNWGKPLGYAMHGMGIGRTKLDATDQQKLIARILRGISQQAPIQGAIEFGGGE